MVVERYTVRLSSVSDCLQLHFESIGQPNLRHSKKTIQPNKSDKVDPHLRRSYRIRKAPSKDEDANNGPNSSRRIQRPCLSISASSPAIVKAEQIRLSGKKDPFVENMIGFALVGALMAGDRIESVYSLSQDNYISCNVSKEIFQEYMYDVTRYPLNLVLVRNNEPTIKTENMTTSRKRRLRQPKSSGRDQRDEVAVIDLQSSDEDDEEPTTMSHELTNGAYELQNPCIAIPDPLPVYRPNDWVITPFGPGYVISSIIHRLAHSNYILCPLVMYQIQLSFGVLWAQSDHVHALTTSTYGTRQIVAFQNKSITQCDMVRLWPGVYLNDNFINFYTTYLQRHCINESFKFHIFASYFYTRLSELDKGQKDTAEHRHHLWTQLRGWTKSVDVLGKNMLVIPIHYRLHWSTVLVCHPNAAFQPDESYRPCLLHLDSGKRFRLHRSTSLFQRIRRYLHACHENSIGFESNSSCTGETMPGILPPVPAQANETDCGLYMLQMMEALLSEPPTISQEFLDCKGNMYPFGKDMLDQRVIDRKRLELQSLVYTLSRNTPYSINFPT